MKEPGMRKIFFADLDAAHPKIRDSLLSGLGLGIYGRANSIEEADYVYSNRTFINADEHPDQKFIFGPQFCVFPGELKDRFRNRHWNSIYIQPSDWATQVWIELGFRDLPLRSFPVGINTKRFCPSETTNENEDVLVYHKYRELNDLSLVCKLLDDNKLIHRIFDYKKGYTEEQYLSCLNNSRFGIWVGCHESQGIALQEALSMNVPLLVWNVTAMKQATDLKFMHRVKAGRLKTQATTTPYWSERCGLHFYGEESLEPTFRRFMDQLNTFTPRTFVVNELSIDKQCREFIELFESI